MTPTQKLNNSSHPGMIPITDRCFAFAVRIVKLCKFLEKAVAGQSKADFIHKNAIALKEARESNYWLRLIIATGSFKEPVATGIVELEQESKEISKIIAKRIVSTKRN